MKIILFLIITISTFSQTLDDYIKMTVDNSYKLKSDSLAYIEKKWESGSVSFDDPVLSGAYFISPIETRAGRQIAKISITQGLPLWGELSAKEDILASNADYLKYHYKNQKLILEFQIKQMWYKLYLLKQKISAKEKIIKLYNLITNLQLTLIESDINNIDTYLLSDIKKDEAEKELNDLKDSYEKLTWDFNLLTGNSSKIIIPDSIDTDFNENNRYDPAENLMLKALKHNEIKAKNRYKLKSLLFQPKFNFGIDYSFIEESDYAMGSSKGKDAIAIKAAIKLPFNLSSKKALIEKEKTAQKTAVNRSADYYQSLELELKKLQNRQADYKRDYNFAKNTLKKLHSLKKIAEKEIENGKSYSSWLKIEEKIINYELKKEIAKTEYIIAKEKMLYTGGGK